NCFTLFHRTGPNDEKPETVRIQTDDTGHCGADGALTRDFLDLIHKKDNPSRPGLKEGIESAIMCLAADKSVERGCSIALPQLHSQVFDPVRPSQPTVTPSTSR